MKEPLEHVIFTYYFKECLSKPFEREHHLVSYHVIFLCFVYSSSSEVQHRFPLVQMGLLIPTNFEKVFAPVKLCCYSYKHFNENWCQLGKVCSWFHVQTALMDIWLGFAVIWLITFMLFTDLYLSVGQWLNKTSVALVQLMNCSLEIILGSPSTDAVVFFSFRNTWIFVAVELSK